MILQKFIANSGYCSRRKAEKLIAEGLSVYVNGKIAPVGMLVDDGDEVVIDGVSISNRKEKIYIKLNKPSGYTSTSAIFKSEKNVYELLPEKIRRDKSLHIVGRLDKDSCGLLLFTNDGDLTQSLTHPSFEHEKKYVVTLRDKRARDVDDIIRKFKQGMFLEEVGNVSAKDVVFLGKNKFEIILTEGKKRQIRKMFAEMHEWIEKLQRISISSLELGDMKEREWKFLTSKEVQKLKK